MLKATLLSMSAGIVSLLFVSSLLAEVQINEARDYTQAEIHKIYSTGSGTSGPGQPVPADWNGFRIVEIGAEVRITAANRDKLA